MKILMINVVCGIGSTGRICIDLADEFIAEGHEVKIAYGREPVPEKYRHNCVRIGNDWDQRLHGLRTRLLDEHGFGSKRVTKKFLKWAEKYNPDIVWIHNIHGYYINIEMLFDWIKSRPQMQVKWTLHDCWAFTGHCSYFSVAKCEQWKNGCERCSQKRQYPSSLLIDNCKSNYERKKRAFTGVKNMTIVTPSEWLQNLVNQSFLKEYPIEVQYNKIDLTTFKPTPSDFRTKYGLEERKIVLGVASTWSARKGLRDFLRLSELLDKTYAIVLVGLTEKQIKAMPEQIICIARTNSVKELVEIYSAADIFVNPSKEETFGLTTIEAQACGTPAIVYRDTACEEVVKKYGGKAVEQTPEAIATQIIEMNEMNYGSEQLQ